MLLVPPHIRDDRVVIVQSRPTVSIVIPAFNHARYLDEAIASVLTQDYPHVELIVFDDGSTDGTRAVLERYGSRFWWATRTNAGQAATLNAGWERASGEILAYLSADDRLEPGAVSRAVAELERSADIIGTYSDFTLIDPSSRSVRTVRTDEYDYARMVATLRNPIGPGAFFRRSAWQATGGWDPELKQIPDLDYWLRLGLQGPFRRIPDVLAAFRVHEASQSFALVDVQRAEEVVRSVERFFDTKSLPATIRALRASALSSAHLRAGRMHLRERRYSRALRSLRHAAALAPVNVLTWQSSRLLLNALFNRTGHRVVWRLNRLRGVRQPATASPEPASIESAIAKTSQTSRT